MKIILFDLDGTLMDTLDDITDAVNFAMKTMGFPTYDRETVRRTVGNGITRLPEALIPPAHSDKLEETLAVFRPYYNEHAAEKSRPYPGIPALLEHLEAEGYLCGIVSNKPNAATLTIAERYFPRFAIALGQREDIPRKPDAAPIFYALKALGGEKKDCIYVGDSEVDLLTAANAGIPCIALTWGFREEKALLEAGAEHLAHTPEELYERIRKLL